MKSVSKVRFDVFTSPLFLSALFLLLINDHFLKHAFGNWLTGKLSDFAGLFVFVQFFAALAPKRAKTIAFTTAAAFVYWKEPASQPLIDGWNALGLFQLSRTVDVTDLAALISIPIAHAHFEALPKTNRASKSLAYAASFVALLAIMGTSVGTHFRSVQVELQGERFTSLETVHTIIDDVAKVHDFKCVDCAPNKSYRQYQRGDRWFETNIDRHGQILFLSVGSRNEQAVDEIAERIQLEIAARLKSVSSQVVMSGYSSPPSFGRRVASIEGSLDNSGSWLSCSFRGTSREFSSLVASLNRDANSRGYDAVSTSYCPSTDRTARCREYYIGRVIGPHAYARSTVLRVQGGCGWDGGKVRIDIESRVDDPTIDLPKLTSDLKELVQKFSTKEVAVDTAK